MLTEMRGGQGKETALAHFETLLLVGLVWPRASPVASFVYPPADVGIIARLDPPPRTWYLITMSEMNYTLLTGATLRVAEVSDEAVITITSASAEMLGFDLTSSDHHSSDR